MSDTVLITKYALSGGVKRATVTKRDSYSDGTPIVHVEGQSFVHYILGRDAFETEAAAIADAEQRRVKKIASLKKQIAKLEKLTFASEDADA